MKEIHLPLSVDTIKELIGEAEYAFRHQECAACECYLGYITQLEIDADPEGRIYIRDYKPPRNQIHPCLGCDPCSPGTLYSDYLRKKAASPLNLEPQPDPSQGPKS